MKHKKKRKRKDGSSVKDVPTCSELVKKGLAYPSVNYFKKNTMDMLGLLKLKKGREGL